MLKTYKYKVDFSEVKHFIEIHEVLKRDLELPDYYGGNTDALWDCLTDMREEIE
jgi:ribonuclease inhibitor